MSRAPIAQPRQGEIAELALEDLDDPDIVAPRPRGEIVPYGGCLKSLQNREQDTLGRRCPSSDGGIVGGNELGITGLARQLRSAFPGVVVGADRPVRECLPNSVQSLKPDAHGCSPIYQIRSSAARRHL